MPHRIKEFQDFIAATDDVTIYLHNTQTEFIAEEILKNGFQFVSHLDYTTDSVSGKDYVELNYFNLTRKRYGTFTIVIHIGKNLIHEYTTKLKNTKYHYSEMLVIGKTIVNDDDETIYTLHPQFIKGFFDQNTKIGVLNPLYNPNLNLSIFQDNVDKVIPFQ